MTDCTLSPDQERVLEDTSECLHKQKDMSCLEISDVKFGERDRGANRIVYSFNNGECVVKLQIPTRPEIEKPSNQREVETWENAPPQMRDWLTPIHDYDSDDYRWLTMPKLQTHETREGRIPFDIEKEFKKTVDEAGWRCVDVRPMNFGQTENGEWKFFDYPDCHEL